MLLVVCAWVTMAFLTPSKYSHQGLNSQLKFSFVPSIKGWAMKPFVYRALVPQTIALLLKVSPDGLESSAARSVTQSGLLSRAFARVKWEPEYALAYFICVALVYGLFLAFSMYAARLILKTNGLEVSAAAERLAAGLVLLGLPPFFKFTSFLYDPAQLLLFTASLYCIFQRRWRAYLVFFTLACFNKETAILLIPIFIFTYPMYRLRLADRTARWLLLTQAVIFVAAKAALAARFSENPGPFVEFHLLDHNLNVLAIGYGWSALVVFAALTFLWLYDWKAKPAFLKTAFLCTLPPMLVIYLFVGWIDEWRVYYEAYPVVAAMAVHTFRSLAARLERRAA
jgi:hypothetical protein